MITIQRIFWWKKSFGNERNYRKQPFNKSKTGFLLNVNNSSKECNINNRMDI